MARTPSLNTTRCSDGWANSCTALIFGRDSVNRGCEKGGQCFQPVLDRLVRRRSCVRRACVLVKRRLMARAGGARTGWKHCPPFVAGELAALITP